MKPTMALEEPQNSTGRFLTLVIGNQDDAEFASVVAWLKAQPDLQTRFVPTLEQAMVASENSPRPGTPDFVVALQTWSDEFSSQELDLLFERSPLARVVCIYGAWCDADGRTRSNWPRPLRVPAALALPRVAMECQFLRGTSEVSPWSWTATREATLAIDYSSECWQRLCQSQPLAGHSVQIVSCDSGYCALLTDALLNVGARIQQSPTAESFWVIDIDPIDHPATAQLMATPANTVCVAGFVGDLQRKQQQGWTTVLKLAPLPELVTSLLQKLAAGRAQVERIHGLTQVAESL